MNTGYFVDDGNLYKIVRETPKTIFYKLVTPSHAIPVDAGVIFITITTIRFRKYSLDNLTVEGEEHKILKRLFGQSKVIEEQEIERVFFENHRKINITQYISNYHLFLIDFDLLEKAYKLRKYILSLTSGYIKNQVFNRNDERTKNI